MGAILTVLLILGTIIFCGMAIVVSWAIQENKYNAFKKNKKQD